MYQMNISTIAQLAEVSTATVSRYLNNGYVSEEKRKRIQEVIERTGYRPSSSAQTLRTGRNNLIGVIVPKISSESVARMVDGITEVVNNAGYQVLLANTGNDTEKELEYLKTFRLNNVDGVIFIGTLMTKKHLALMKSYKKPIVLMGQQESEVSSVYFDDYGAAQLATDCLVRCGCKNIAHLAVTLKDKAAGRARRSGYLDTLEQNHMPFREDLIIESAGFTTQNGSDAMQAFLEKGIAFEDRHIVEANPTAEELKAWHEKSGLPLKRFFNTSGMKYKELGLKDKLPNMTEEEQYALLATDGMLVKRPLLVGEEFAVPGFKEVSWEEVLS